MNRIFRHMTWHAGESEAELLLSREWLVTNGLGGYASGTVSTAPTRRYHGYLISALPSPLGRTMMLGNVLESFRLPDGEIVDLTSDERVGGALRLQSMAYLQEFRLESGLPVWRWKIGDFILERQIFLPYLQNTVFVVWRMLEGPSTLRMRLRPTVDFRSHDAPVNTPLAAPYTLTHCNGRYELTSAEDLPPLRMRIVGDRSAFTIESQCLREVLYRVEESRGYDFFGEVWSPGLFRADLAMDRPVALVASTESWDVMEALEPADALHRELERRSHLISIAHPAAHEGAGAEFVLAADQFIIDPSITRTADAARAHAAGHEPRSVIAGYHWFTDWGRDTMISLEGLTLCTGRSVEAGHILRTFADYIRDGLIPNLFPEGGHEGLYHTADATLWFFHAIQRYIEVSGDREILATILPKMLEIVRHHIAGTRFGIGVDPADGLLRQGAPGYQLTWMDAKVGDWVVTPRRGKAVEINALWYNALCLTEAWLRDEGLAQEAVELAHHASRCKTAFNQRFWYAAGGYLYDVVDGEDGRDDPACRPNQLFSFSLAHPVLHESRWASVLQVAEDRLVTPVGLRSLSPDHPDYKARYFGDLRSRDAAYHQGTVWGWLVGPFLDAWLKVHPGENAKARQLLEGFVPHLGEACVGSVSEVFDAEAPFTPRGCVAQAWSVAEALRVWIKTAS
jgi:predicted glycogen debranching enzyme